MTTYARLPERMRVIELARRLDVPAAELQKRLNRLDIAAPTVLTSIARSEIRVVLEDYRAGDSNGSNTPDPDLIDELLGSLGPSPFSRINDAAVTGDNEFVAHFRKEGDEEEFGYQDHPLLERDDLTVEIDLDVEEPRVDEVPADAVAVEESETPVGAVEHEPLPERMRIFELARQLDVPAAELQKRLNRLGIEAKSVLKAVDRSEIRLVLEDYRGGVGDASTTPDPTVISELLSSLGAPSEDLTPRDDQEGDTDHDHADGDLDEEHPAFESEPVALDDDLPEAVVEGDLSDTDAAASEESPDADSTLVDREASEQEALASHLDLDQDDSFIEDSTSEDLLDDTSSNAAPGQSKDDVLQAALVQAGVVEDDAGSEQKTVDDTEVVTAEADKPRGFFRRWRGVKARTRIIAVGIGILVGTMVLATVYAVLRPTYAAESEIVITISGLGGEEIQRELQSFAVVAGSQTVLAPVAEEFGMSVPDIRQSFAPEIVGDSTVLRFTTTGSSPEEALALNEAITASYLAVANEPLDQSQLAFVTERIDLVTQQIADLDADLAEVELLEAANASTRLQIESEANIAQAQLADLQGLLVDLRASGAAPPGSVTFVEGQINTTETRLDELVTEAQALESEDAGVRSSADRLRDERTVLRSELGDLQELQVQIEFDQVAGNRVAVLAAGHATDDAVGLTPVRAIVLGLLVGGALAFAWVVAATQLRKKK